MLHTNIYPFHQNEFTQTFGKASKQLSSLSNTSRQHFDLLKIAQDKPQYFMLSDKSKNNLTFRSKNNYESQGSESSKEQLRKQHSKIQIDHIDKINDKISGMIKSISASCLKASNKQKQQPKTPKDSNKKHHLNQQKALIESYKNDQLTNNRIKFKSDVQKTQKKMNFIIQGSSVEDNKYIKFSLFDEKKGIKNSRDKSALKEASYGAQDYDEMSLRIKKINDKINNYELRIRGNKPKPNPMHYIHNVDYPNKSAQIRYPLNQIIHQQPDSHKFVQQGTHKKSGTNAIKSQTVTSKTLKYKEQISMKLNKIGNFNDYLKSKNNKQLKDYQKKGFFKDSIASKENMANKTYLNPKFTNIYQQNTENKGFKESFQGNSSAIKIRPDDEVNNSQLLNLKDNQPKLKPQEKKDNCPIQKNQVRNRVMLQQLSYKPTFLKSLVRQIQLDQDFRYTKYMFGGIQDVQQHQTSFGPLKNIKWANLQRQLQNQGFKLSMNQVKEIFVPKDDEIDPFMSVSHCHQELIHGLIFAYQSCQRHWNENILRNQTGWQLKECNFTEQNIDRGKKGYISLQDLTFYINTQVDGGYRNRDLMLVAQRLTSQWRKTGSSEKGLIFATILQHLLSC